MDSDPQVVSALNLALKNQLTAINQYFLHARMLKNWGLEKLNEAEYKHSIRAMKAADDLIERVLFLEGLPNLQDLGKLLIGENAAEILSADLKLGTDLRRQLVDAVGLSEGASDYVSRDLLEDLLEHTEEQIDWLESQLWLIEHSGIENYLQAQI